MPLAANSLSTETRQALQLLEKIKKQLHETEGTHLNPTVREDLNLLISVLNSPVFTTILNIQDSLQELKEQLYQHPSIMPIDFDISPSNGDLVLNVPLEPTTLAEEDSPSPSEEPHHITTADLSSIGGGVREPFGPITTESYAEEFRRTVERNAMGREIITIRLLKAEGASLGISVVGLRSEHRGEIGIFVQEIQDNGIAARDGRLQEGDQILAIDGQPLDSNISHQQAINILHKARGFVELVVARADATSSSTPEHQQTMLFSTPWAEVQAIELVNDGTGLGFGIVGGKGGVIVKTIVQGGVADRDGRLQSGDHILQIGTTDLRRLGSEEAAAVLRQAGVRVRLLVARPAPSPDFAPGSAVVAVPTSRLTADPDLLHLAEEAAAAPDPPDQPPEPDAAPDMETLEVELVKNQHGLGITIAGYVCEREELSGIFVKSIARGSAADKANKIKVNDQIIEVDGRPLHGYTNHQAVEVLRNTGQVVKLRLARYLKGHHYQRIQQAIAKGEMVSTSSMFADTTDPDLAALDTTDGSAQNFALPLDPQAESALKAKWSNIMGPDYEIVVAQLSKFREGGGLGISLEGTVDVEGGQEVRPHHYIRSILPDGPVGVNGVLVPGDELLEVNSKILHGLNHVEVVTTLRELPLHVRMVCARRIASSLDCDSMLDTSCLRQYDMSASLPELLDIRTVIPAAYGSTSAAVATVPSPGGVDRLVKAKSDGSLAPPPPPQPPSRLKSRSLEPLTGLAMWSTEPHVIELVKGDRGLGFSILDYQDPMNPKETVIVIRSLVPGGVAQQDGRLIPGDRLLFVNDIRLDHASLDTAVAALKGAPRGPVRIGVAKPLPLPDQITVEETSSLQEFPPPVVEQSNVPTPPAPPRSLSDPSKYVPRSAPIVMPLPAALERVARIKKDADFIGLAVELADEGLNGVLVTSVVQGGIIHKDGQIRAGDYLLSLNGATLRNVPPLHIHALLRQAELGSEDLIIKYIPASDAAVHHQSTLLSLQQETSSSPVQPCIPDLASSQDGGSPSPPPPPEDLSRPPFQLPLEPLRSPKPPVPFKPKNLLERSSLRSRPSAATTTSNTSTTTAAINSSTTAPSSSSSPSPLPSPVSPLPSPSGLPALTSRLWGPPRTVELWRKPPSGLGISIIGGKVDSMPGIFIKNVLAESSAGASSLKSGDLILEVDGKDLRGATHDEAVQVIKQAKNPVRFVVQSLIATPRKKLDSAPKSNGHAVVPIENCKSEPQFEPSPYSKSEDVNDLSNHDDVPQKENHLGERRSEAPKDDETEDEFGYTPSKIQERYAELLAEKGGEILIVDLERGPQGLGFSLAGNKDRTKMSVFVCGLHPGGRAAKDGRIRVGDELLEVNGRVMKEKCHLNASAMIKTLKDTHFKVILYRHEDNLKEMAVKPLTHFPAQMSTEEFFEEERASCFRDSKTVTVFKDASGVGIQIIEGKHSALGPGIFIAGIHSGSPAHLAGLNVGDMILSVNGVSLIGLTRQEAADLLLQSEASVTLVVATPSSWSSQSERTLGSPEVDPDPLTCPILPGKETRIQISKEKIGLGLSIVGGTDTPLGAVVIHEVYQDGAAYFDTRLQPGDQILEVNGRDLREATHEQAIAALRNSLTTVELLVYREDRTEELYETFEVGLTKRPGRGLGLSIVGRRNGPGVYVAEVIKGGIAESDGRIIQGDLILEVNGHDMRNATQEFAATLLKVSTGHVHFKLARLKACPRHNMPSPKPEDVDERDDDAAGYKIVVLERGTEENSTRLGFTIVGGQKSPHGNLPIYVKEISEDGAAAQEGSLRPGDRIIAVNGRSLEGLTHSEVADQLKALQGTITLTVAQ